MSILQPRGVAWIGLGETQQEDHDFFVKCTGFLSIFPYTKPENRFFLCKSCDEPGDPGAMVQPIDANSFSMGKRFHIPFCAT